MKSSKPISATKPKITLIEEKDEEKKEELSEDEDDINVEEIKSSMFERFGHPTILKRLVIALSVIIVVICIGFVIYQFYTKRAQQKFDICQQDKMSSYEKRIHELSEHADLMMHENRDLTNRLTTLENEYKNAIENVKKLEYENKPQTVYRVNKKAKKQPQRMEPETEDDSDETNEYTVEHPKFQDAPISKGKKKVNPQQALKTHINEGAKKAYDKKQSMIQQQMDNDREEEMEQEQKEIQKQLGLGREINDEKLMEIADEQQASNDKENDQPIEDDDDVVEIESLIA